MNLHELKKSFIERNEKGEPYQDLAEEYGISKPAVGRIIAGKKPGTKVAAILNLDPSRALIRTRARRARLNAVAIEAGYSSWYAYEEIMQFWQVP